MDNWIDIACMGMSAALMALFCERMLCSRYSCLRMLLHTALLCAGRLLPLPACLTLLPLPFILLQAREGRLMLSEILLPCALYALTLDLELILPFPFVCSAALMIPLPLAAPWLRRLYTVFQQDKAPALLMMLLVYLLLVSFSLMALPFSAIPFALAAGCVVLTLCADMALLPLLQHLFLHAQEEEQLSRMYTAYGMRLRSRMMDKRDGSQLRRMRHDIINLIQTITVAREREEGQDER